MEYQNQFQIQVASRMQDFEEGIFQVLNQKKNEWIAQGRKVYNFSVGTPNFKPQPCIMEAVQKAAQDPDNYKYALVDLPELTQAVIDRYRSRYQVELTAQEVTSVYGSQEGIAHIGLSLCNSGDVVLVPNPGYPIFGIGPSLAGARVVPYDLLPENDYLPVLSDIPEEILRRTKFMLVSYPMNPICKCAPRCFYEELITWAKKHGIILLHDNAYSDIIYDGREGISILSIEGAGEICVELYSLSKSYNYTGARMGFLVGNSSIVQNFKKLRSQIDYGTFLPVQYGAVAALQMDDCVIREQCMQYQKRRDALCGGLRSIGWQIQDSEGTMFAWGRIPKGYDDDTSFVMELFQRTGVLCTPGSSFGSRGRGYVRFALVLPPEEIEQAIRAIEESGILTDKI